MLATSQVSIEIRGVEFSLFSTIIFTLHLSNKYFHFRSSFSRSVIFKKLSTYKRPQPASHASKINCIKILTVHPNTCSAIAPANLQMIVPVWSDNETRISNLVSGEPCSAPEPTGQFKLTQTLTVVRLILFPHRSLNISSFIN